MRKIVRALGIGAIIGTLTAGVLTAPVWLPAAIASDDVVSTLKMSGGEIARQIETSAYDPDSFVRFGDRFYTVTYDDSVAEATHQARVKKVAYGKVSYVDIAYSPTGVYSNEAMFSPHVRYPGIYVTEAPAPDIALAISQWVRGLGWAPIALTNAGNFTHFPSDRHVQRVE